MAETLNLIDQKDYQGINEVQRNAVKYRVRIKLNWIKFKLIWVKIKLSDLELPSQTNDQLNATAKLMRTW